LPSNTPYASVWWTLLMKLSSAEMASSSALWKVKKQGCGESGDQSPQEVCEDSD